MRLISYKKALQNSELVKKSGKVTQIFGLTVESNGPDAFLGELCEIKYQRNQKVNAEVVAIKNGLVYLMPYSDLMGIYLGSEVNATGFPVTVSVGDGLLGRVINAFGAPLDELGALKNVNEKYPLYSKPLNPLKRARIEHVMESGVKSIDSLLTLGKGQRVGIFAGSGVGKSTLLGMIARHMKADVNVIALVGERGREVKEFIEKSLGDEGLKKSIVIVATSDETALTRTHAALSATAIAEYFRDQGKDVMLIMDSVTRYAMALREIGLAVGEPPTARGYTPSVFASLPKLIERCGSSDSGGSITALYTVLVEGDDHNDPISDSLRAILDGHFVLSRDIANQGQYPAVDILQSNSRLMNDLIDSEDMALANEFTRYVNIYEKSRNMIELGAYKSGSNPELDKVLKKLPDIKSFLSQNVEDSISRNEAMKSIKRIING
ncbi:MAG: FliI/YscN family ATPase [Gammaproteobacteria bacterium]|nr:FliI/YscN family ATPase [Gammaproteobacteria bacterium]